MGLTSIVASLLPVVLSLLDFRSLSHLHFLQTFLNCVKSFFLLVPLHCRTTSSTQSPSSCVPLRGLLCGSLLIGGSLLGLYGGGPLHFCLFERCIHIAEARLLRHGDTSQS